MYSIKVDKSKISLLKTILVDQTIYTALNKGAYKVFFSYSTSLDAIRYEAKLIKENYLLPKYIEIYLLPSGEIKLSLSTINKNYQNQFYLFILEQDSLKTETELEKLYSPILKTSILFFH